MDLCRKSRKCPKAPACPKKGGFNATKKVLGNGNIRCTYEKVGRASCRKRGETYQEDFVSAPLGKSLQDFCTTSRTRLQATCSDSKARYKAVKGRDQCISPAPSKTRHCLQKPDCSIEWG